MAEPKEITKFVFQPLATESVFFHLKGAFIEQATISVGNVLLSIIKPQYGTFDASKDTPPDIELPFFGTVPFHGALSTNWEPVMININAYGNVYPSLVMESAVKTITWADVPDKILREKVVVGSAAGEKTLMMIYLPHTCGYQKLT